MVRETTSSPWLGLMTSAFALGHSAIDQWAAAFGVAARAEPGRSGPPMRWRTAREVVLDLPTMRLRRVPGASKGRPILIVAPFSAHTSHVADFAPGHSVSEALARATGRPVYVTEWRTATAAMRDYAIDHYLSDLHVVAGDLGRPDAVGLCQGGWLALAREARFPGGFGRLVLAGAPVDFGAGESLLSRIARDVPDEVYEALIRVGEGRLRGDALLSLWSLAGPDRGRIMAILQPAAPSGRLTEGLIRRFRAWHAEPVDLPGPFYRQTVRDLYRENRLARGRFTALGRRISLGTITAPLCVLVAAGDLVTHPRQALAVCDLVATDPADTATIEVDGSHLTLFMGRTVLSGAWLRIADWLGPARRALGAAA